MRRGHCTGHASCGGGCLRCGGVERGGGEAGGRVHVRVEIGEVGVLRGGELLVVAGGVRGEVGGGLSDGGGRGGGAVRGVAGRVGGGRMAGGEHAQSWIVVRDHIVLFSTSRFSLSPF